MPFANWSQETEADIKETAESLFKKEEYVEATSFFLKLLALQPKDPNYNFKYGTCLLYNSNKKQDAIRYLAFAVKSPTIVPDAFYFLGKAYHLNYQFTEAITNYKAYQDKAGAKGAYYLGASRNIEMCLNGKELLSSITEIAVKKKTEITNSEFFRIYDMTNIGGTILVQKERQSKVDKKMNHVPIVHFPDGATKVFFSSYGDGNNKDIYYYERNGGNSSNPIKVEGVNTQFDEDFPYMHPNGEYLYFSSKGHNSMGGYDVFRARYNASTNSFGNVENVDFAISSPDDDLFYMVDKEDKYAYFASARQSQNGKIHVYEVLVDRFPIQMAILKGSFESNLSGADRTMIVDVFNKTSGARVGRFRTNEFGEYVIQFPSGGLYEFRATVQCSGEKFVSSVDIPFLKNFKALKQKAVHEVAGEKETLKFINLFDEEVEDAQSLLAEFLKQRSDLEVNINNFNMNALTAAKQKSPILAELGLGKMSTFEASEMMAQKASELERGGDGGQSGANALIVNSAEEVRLIDQEIADLVAQSKAATSDEAKYALLEQARQLAESRDQKMNAIKSVENTLANVTSSEVSPENRQDFIEAAEQIKSLVASGKEDEALALMEKNRSAIKSVLNSAGGTNTDELAKKEQKLKSELQKLDDAVDDYTKEIEIVQSEIATMTEERNGAANKDKEAIQARIDAKNEQLAEIKTERVSVQKSQKNKANELNTVSTELEANLALKNYSGPKVTSEQAQTAKNGLQNEQAKTVKNTIETELADLLAKNPELEGSAASTVAAVTPSNTNSTNNGTNNGGNNGTNNTSTNDVASVTLASVSKSVDPNYESKLDQIESGTGSPKEKLEAIQALDESYLASTRAKYDRTERALKGNPQDAALKKELDLLSDMIDQKLTQIGERENELAQLSDGSSDVAVVTPNNTNPNNTNPTNTNPTNTNPTNTNPTNTNPTNTNPSANNTNSQVSEPVRKQIIESVDEYYDIEIKALNRSTGPDKETKIVNREQRLQSTIGKRISAIEELKANGSADPGLDTELAVLIEEQKRSADRVRAIEEGASDVAVNDGGTNSSGTNDFNTPTTSLATEDIIKAVDATYLSDIDRLENSSASDKYTKLLDRELEFQNNLGRRIASKTEQLAEDESNEDLKQELAVLKSELSTSRRRANEYEEKADQESTVAGTPSFDSEKYIDEVRSDLLSQNAPEVESSYSTKEELEKQDDVLKLYETELKNIIASKKRASNVGTDPRLIGELRSVEEELAIVQKKRREISVTIGEIDQLAASNTDIVDNTVLKSEIDKNNDQIASLMRAPGLTDEEIEYNQAKKASIDKFISFAEAAESEEGKNKLLNIGKKDQANFLNNLKDGQIAKREAALAQSAGIEEISTKEELEKLRRRYSIEVGEITKTIIAAKDPENGSPDAEKIALLEKQKLATEAKLNQVDSRLAKLKDPEPVIAESAKNQTVPANEQAQIAASNEYSDFVEAATSAQETEEEIKKLENSINQEKEALREFIEDEVNNGTDRSTEIEERKNRIRRYSVTMGELQTQYLAKRQNAISQLPSDPKRSAYYQNMMHRGVAARPAVAQNPTTPTNLTNPTNPSNTAQTPGIDINPNRTTPATIAIGPTNQSGLVFKVQIGAFSRPLPSGAFREFSPVTGEKVGSTNITRYMAGAFSQSSKVLEARDQIRRMGYTDAFPVAYCNGERISFAEAVALQNSGSCGGTGSNQLTVNNETPATPATPSTPAVDVSYNVAPGSAPAVAIEQKQGLFFTVQVGVFNRPAQHSQLFFLEPLMTLKLPNNQIRYSVGMFKSLADAKVKLADAKAKGITDAFVTVYYKGQRISLQEGLKLLETQGASILEPSTN